MGCRYVCLGLLEASCCTCRTGLGCRLLRRWRVVPRLLETINSRWLLLDARVLLPRSLHCGILGSRTCAFASVASVLPSVSSACTSSALPPSSRSASSCAPRSPLSSGSGRNGSAFGGPPSACTPRRGCSSGSDATISAPESSSVGAYASACSKHSSGDADTICSL